MPELSVFFPAYNEEENLERTIKSTLKLLPNIAKKWEVIIVNDGSRDRTGEIAKKLSEQNDRIKVMSHKVNKGYGEALKTGFRNARHSWVAFTDSDGQFDFSEIRKFLPHTKTADLILGYRLDRADPILRRIYGFVWGFIAKVLLGITVRDYSCGFKLIKKEVFDRVEPLEAGEKVTQLEMLAKAKRLGFKTVEIGVHHFPRRFGQQTGANIMVTAKSILDLLKLWWKFINKIEFFGVFLIILVAAFLRLFKIDGYMTFLGDEGRDVIFVRRLLVNFDPILVGPGTSIGNMYLGPLYYYMMAPALFLAGLSPVGPAVQIAVLGVITVWLVWFVAREWFPSAASGQVAWSGIVAASLYAVSPIIIIHAHSSWNPNIMPFFALLSIYSIWQVWKYNAWKWLIILGISYAFVLQSHYLGLLLLPVLGLFWLLSIISVWNTVQKFYALRFTLYASAIFALLMSPLVIFDARHSWRNFQAIYTFFSARQETVSLRPWSAIPEMWPIWNEKFITRFMGGTNENIGFILSIILAIGFVVLIIKSRKSFFYSPLFILVLWLIVGLIGLGIYKQEIYDHYFGFIFAAPFILLGVIAQKIYNLPARNAYGITTASGQFSIFKIFIIGGVTTLIILNILETPIKDPPQRQFQRTEEVARKIAQEAGGKPLNLAVLAERNYEDAYQYFLEWWKEPVRDIDPLRYDQTVAEQLFVVCELPPQKCDPTHNPKAEITVFGWSKIEKEWDVAGVKLYKLVHNPTGKP